MRGLNEEILRERTERIMVRLRWDHGVEGEPAFVAVFCNACGAEEVANTVDELAPKIAGWALDGDPDRGMDFCPRCL